MIIDDSSNELVDIRSISVNKNLPKNERIYDYIKQIKNPYRFKCGDIVITAKYSKTGPTIDECLHSIMN